MPEAVKDKKVPPNANGFKDKFDPPAILVGIAKTPEPMPVPLEIVEEPPDFAEPLPLELPPPKALSLSPLPTDNAFVLEKDAEELLQSLPSHCRIIGKEVMTALES